MASDRQLIVRVIGDDSSLQRMFERDRRATQRLDKDIEKSSSRRRQALGGAFDKIAPVSLGAGAAGLGALAGGATVLELKRAVNAASDLNEQVTKNQQVFGQSAQAVLDWSKTTSTAIGTSQTAALTAAGTFGNLFRAIGVGSAQAAQQSQSLVKLAADLASFNNTSVEDALDAIRSGLIGEAEPLRRYGVLLSEARVQQIALQQTGKDNAKSLTAQEKALARVSIIFRDTAAAQGDFGRTSSGLANQQRILSAQVQDLQANLGRLLLPAVTQIVGALNDTATVALKAADGLQALGDVKIPAIHIPFFFDFPGGGSIGGPAKAAGKAFLGAANPAIPVIESIAGLLGSGAETAANAQQAPLAESFRSSVQGMFSGALQSGLDAAFSTPPKVKAPKGVKGFGSGLTPQDLFGPLIKDIPAALQESLLDIQIASPNNHEAIIKVLEQERDSLLEALDDPRLKRKGRVQIKEKLKGVNAAIESENDAVKQTVKDAADKRKQAAQDAKDAADKARQDQRDAFDKVIEALTLQIDQATVTKNFSKAKQTISTLIKAVQEQIKVEGKTPELLRQLFQLRQQNTDLINDQKNTDLFKLFGLDSEGNQKPPTRNNLIKQFQSLTGRLDGVGKDLGGKLGSQFDIAGKVLKDKTKALTPEIRKFINDLFGEVRATFDDNGKNTQHTIETAINRNSILKGLGLDSATENALKHRLQGFNTRGKALAPPAGAFGAFGVPLAASGQPINITTTVVLDDKIVGQSVTNYQGKKKRSNPRQKRGWGSASWL